MAGTILTTITTLPVWTNKLCRTVSPNRSWWSQQWIRRIIHVTNWMAGTILTSSPHYFYAVEIMPFSWKTGWLWLPCGANKRSPNHTACMNKLCTTSLRRKDSIFYANRLVTSMYWVVKWATLSAAQAYTHWPTHSSRGPEWKTQAYTCTGPSKCRPTNSDSGLSFRTSMKAHRRAKAQQASKQAQVHARRPTWSIKMKSPSKVAPRMKSCKGSEPITSKWCSAVSTQVAVVHDRPATSQSCYPYLPTNRPITLSLPFNQPLRFRFCSSI
jgi:hypothetical protein